MCTQLPWQPRHSNEVLEVHRRAPALGRARAGDALKDVESFQMLSVPSGGDTLVG